MRLGSVLRLRSSRVGVQGGSASAAAAAAAGGGAADPALGPTACAAQELLVIPRKPNRLVSGRVWVSSALAAAAAGAGPQAKLAAASAQRARHSAARKVCAMLAGRREQRRGEAE